ncbi:MAG: phosphoenolpyruvate carboxykinase (ATP) [Saprospiraceae bacterium]|nr:phosphoenolpyruvate carboxykinase (ATP) [Saprospiraceae bacterium]
MNISGKIANAQSLVEQGLNDNTNIKANLNAEDLVQISLAKNLGVLSDNGALCILTGEFTGRSPDDKFTVKDQQTERKVDWNKFNQEFGKSNFDLLWKKVCNYLNAKEEVYVQDNFACAHEKFKIGVRTIAEIPWSAQFASNMFIRPNDAELQSFEADWVIYCAPGFHADAAIDHTRKHNFSIIDFSSRRILIGGSAYTGEIKKSIFTILNYELPVYHNVLPMHCSANVGKDGDTSIFFGLSGTGKTSLSADPERFLIGDDEHGWSDEGVFNFEGGCYAKCIDLTEDKEPDIYRAIKPGAILENIVFYPGTNKPNFADKSITENTRVSYPLSHINNIRVPSFGPAPKNIFFLTCDAYGILPPISKLDDAQAMYHFISGYTAKVAGTEAGVTEPKATFSACFGAPFLPLHPTRYAELLGERINRFQPNIWLLNTGWTGGPYGVGKRINISYTRAMLSAAVSGELNHSEYDTDSIFGLKFPKGCSNVPDQLLNTRNTWTDQNLYNQKAIELAKRFIANFEKYSDKASAKIIAAGPKI